MEMENFVIDNLQSSLPDIDGKFASFEAHLGKPALHEALDDGKIPRRLLEYIRQHLLHFDLVLNLSYFPFRVPRRPSSLQSQRQARHSAGWSPHAGQDKPAHLRCTNPAPP